MYAYMRYSQNDIEVTVDLVYAQIASQPRRHALDSLTRIRTGTAGTDQIPAPKYPARANLTQFQ
jgi:hypothetical protein